MTHKTLHACRFLIVQPWTQHLKRRFIDATVVSEHHTVEDAYGGP